jgi:transcriptional regulator with XRE-family HTH domain
MARKLSARELVQQVAAKGAKTKSGEYRPLTQKEIAKKIGVHERTIRKWIAGEKRQAAERASKLQRAASSARATNRALARRETKGRQPLPRDVPIPHAMRRDLRVYRAGKWTGEYHESDWVNYDVKRWRVPDVLDFIEALRERGADLRMQIQLIYLAPKVASGDSGTPYSAELMRIGSPIVDVGGRNAPQLREFFSRRLEGKKRHPLFVAVLDVTSGGNDDEEWNDDE